MSKKFKEHTIFIYARHYDLYIVTGKYFHKKLYTEIGKSLQPSGI